MLFRSVADDADPLVEEMRRRDIPYVVKGLNRLFDSPEIEAVVGDLPLHGRPRRRADSTSSLGRTRTCPCRTATGRRRWPSWTTAATSTGANVGASTTSSGSTSSFSRRSACARRPFRATRCAASSSSTSSGSSARRSRTSRRSTSTPSQRRSTRPSRTGLSTRRLTTTQSRTPTSGTRTPDAVTLTTVHQAKGMQWPAVFIPCLRNNRFPVESGKAGSASSTSFRTRRSPMRTATAARLRRRDAAVLRRSHTCAEVPVRVFLARPGQPALQEAVGLLRPLLTPGRGFTFGDVGVVARIRLQSQR